MLSAPALFLLTWTWFGDLGPRPFNEAIHHVGLWAIRFLILSLLITPLRRLARYPAFIDVRRMTGVASFLYIALHLTLYITDQSFDMVMIASEIVLRIYLTIGFTAWLGLAALAATSNDYMVRRLGGGRWRKLHRLIYLIAVLACVHYFMQVKLGAFQPTVLAGLFLWLMLYRIAHWTLPRSYFSTKGELHLWLIGLIGIAASGITFVAEAFAFWIAFGASPLMVLAVDFTFAAGIRPGWYVFAGGLIMFLIALWRLRLEGGLFRTPASSRSKSNNLGRTPS